MTNVWGVQEYVKRYDKNVVLTTGKKKIIGCTIYLKVTGTSIYTTYGYSVLKGRCCVDHPSPIARHLGGDTLFSDILILHLLLYNMQLSCTVPANRSDTW